MVDLFSHCIELAPLEDQTAEFKRAWIYRGHGVPKVLLTDQGPNVDGRKVREMCRQLGIEKRHTTAYHPQADGMAERGIGAVKQTLRWLLLDFFLGNVALGLHPTHPEISLTHSVNSVSFAYKRNCLLMHSVLREGTKSSYAPRDVPRTPVTFESYWTLLKETKEALSSLARNTGGHGPSGSSHRPSLHAG